MPEISYPTLKSFVYVLPGKIGWVLLISSGKVMAITTLILMLVELLVDIDW